MARKKRSQKQINRINKFHASQATFLKTLFSKDGNIYEACIAANISRGSYYIWMLNDDFAEKVEDVRKSLLDWGEAKLIGNAREGKERSLEIFLKAHAPERYNDKIDFNHSGSINMVYGVVDKLAEVILKYVPDSMRAKIVAELRGNR